MNTYQVLIGLMIVGYIILLYITSKQSDIIEDQEQTIKILNTIYANFKDTCKCCETIHDGVIQEYDKQLEFDTKLISKLNKEIREYDRW